MTFDIISSTKRSPILRMPNIGGLANKMLELMFALSVKKYIPSLAIANMTIEAWNLEFPDVERREPSLVLPNTMRINAQKLAQEITHRDLQWVSYPGYAQHMANFDADMSLFERAFPSGQENGFDSDRLVINIRGGEILDGRHPGYVLLLISFYKYVVKLTGLRPVFFGQIDENVYVEALRAAFPQAEFVASRGALKDFDTLRKSKNIIPAVSTFSWLAAWFSNANVHLPVIGLFNPFQEKEHFLLAQ